MKDPQTATSNNSDEYKFYDLMERFIFQIPDDGIREELEYALKHFLGRKP